MSGFPRTDVSVLLASLVPVLVMGMTLFLALGCLVMRMTRSPVHRQRLGEMTLLGALLWSVLAIVPLPRLLPNLGFHAFGATAEAFDANVPQSSMPPESFRLAGSLDQPESRQVTLDVDPARVEAQLSELDKLLRTESPTGQSAEITRTDATPAIASHVAQQRHTSLVAHAPLPGPASSVTGSVAGPSQITSIEILAGLYLAGASVCVLWLTIGQVLLLRIRQQAQRPEPWLSELFRSVQPEFPANVARLIVSTRCARALSWGIWRPIIVLPQSLCHRQNHAQLRTILLHELGHVAQRDAWGNLLICCASPLLYLHPLFWWLRVQIRLAAELIADDWAAQQTGKEAYVEELVALAKVTAGRGILLPGVTGVLSSPSQFYRRMNMLLAREEPLTTRPSAAWRLTSVGAWIIAVGLATSIAGVQPAAGQATPDVPAVGAAPSATPPATEGSKENPALTLPVPSIPSAVSGSPDALPPVEARNPQPVPAYPTPRSELPAKYVESERARLRAELQQIEARLKALDQKEPVYGRYSMTRKVRDGETVTVIRVDEAGKPIAEIWSVDESGRPARLITRSQAGQNVPNAIYANPQARTAPVIAEPRIENGKTVLHYYVVEAGGEKREIAPTIPGLPESNDPARSAVPPKPGDPNVGSYTAKTRTPEIALPQVELRMAQPANVASRLPGNDHSGASQQLDLVSLATSYADAVGAVESARDQLAAIEPLEKTAAVSTRELTAARVTLRNAERKEALLRRIASSATTHTKHQFEQLQTLYKSGAASMNELQEVESRLDILKQILETQPTGDGTTGNPKPVLPPAGDVPKTAPATSQALPQNEPMRVTT